MEYGYRMQRGIRPAVRRAYRGIVGGGRPARTGVNRLSRRITRLERGFGKELKTFDDEPFATAVSSDAASTGRIIAISNMAQGDTSLTREGLQIFPRHLQWNFKCIVDRASTVENLLHLMLFVDTQQSGVHPLIGDLMEQDAVQAFTEHDARPRFKVLRRFRITLNNLTKTVVWRHGIIKFGKGMKIWYKGVDGTAASLGKNNLYLYLQSNVQAANNPPACTFETRLRFTE